MRCRERIAAAEPVRTELPFVFTLETEGRSLLVNGVVDVHAVESAGGLLVVDYKSNRLEGRTPAEITEADYTTQRLVYALAALRSGAPAGRGGLRVPRAAGGAGRARPSPRPMPPGSSASCSSSPRA